MGRIELELVVVVAARDGDEAAVVGLAAPVVAPEVVSTSTGKSGHEATLAMCCAAARAAASAPRQYASCKALA
jgi:hypothetical protein